MIIDNLANLYKYVDLNPLFKDVVEFIKSNDLSKLSEGKHTITGDDAFVTISTVKAKTKEEATLETHKKMIDIQIPLSASETYGYTPLSDLPDADYNNDKDITFYYGISAQNYIACDNQMFAIFFPQDGHAPCISMQNAEIHKAIFKVKA